MNTINRLAADIKDWRISKGFVTPDSLTGEDADAMLGKLMLVVTEISEAHDENDNPDPQPFEEEIADIAIRLLDIISTMGLDPTNQLIYTLLDYPAVDATWMGLIKAVVDAAEAVRDKNLTAFERGVSVALALTFCIAKNEHFDLLSAIEDKMTKNQQRPMRHGRQTSL